MKQPLASSIKILLLSLMLAFGVSFVSATIVPPALNIPAPINATTSTQTMSTGLSVASLSVSGTISALVSDSLVVGTATTGGGGTHPVDFKPTGFLFHKNSSASQNSASIILAVFSGGGGPTSPTNPQDFSFSASPINVYPNASGNWSTTLSWSVSTDATNPYSSCTSNGWATSPTPPTYGHNQSQVVSLASYPEGSNSFELTCHASTYDDIIHTVNVNKNYYDCSASTPPGSSHSNVPCPTSTGGGTTPTTSYIPLFLDIKGDFTSNALLEAGPIKIDGYTSSSIAKLCATTTGVIIKCTNQTQP